MMIPEIHAYIMENRAAIFSLLEELVLIQSYSHNKAGVDRVSARIASEMTPMGFSCEFQRSQDFGDTLIARSPGWSKKKQQTLITGHMDTVFPEDSSFNWYRESDSQCFGPGVADMKGGLVVGIFALKALIHAGRLNEIPITFVFNSDEEIGSPSSRELIRKEADRSRLAYVLEAGGLSNEIVTGRKGNFSVEMTITGKAGHAAFAGPEKASAILEMAHKTLKIEALNAPERGISANVGTVRGGIGSNTVPDRVAAALDFRFLTPEDAASIKAAFTRISETITVPGTASELTIKSSRPAMPQSTGNVDLYKQIRSLAADLGFTVPQELRQGVSDANIIAGQGIPVVDGLGPVGAKDHSEDEFIDKASLWERTLLFAHILATI
jgi:glutamate carboxypeptidase